MYMYVYVYVFTLLRLQIFICHDFVQESIPKNFYLYLIYIYRYRSVGMLFYHV